MSTGLRLTLKIWAGALLAFALLAARFAPNWTIFAREYRSAMAQAPDAAHRTAVATAFLRTIPVERGLFVARQVADLSTEIDNPNHRIVRWRLLVPALGHLLRLPAVVVLGLGLAGGFGLVAALLAVGLRNSDGSRRSLVDAICLGVVGGATAPLITSLGWLGYYDAWLAVALLGAAFARPRWIVVLACVLAPWIDERFVLGLPLALAVRWVHFERAGENVCAWARREAVLPLALVILFSVVRLGLGGTGGSQTVAGYLDSFVFGRDLKITRALFGAWEGLRVGWLLVFAVGVGAIGAARFKPGDVRFPLVLLLAAGSTVVGLLTALDLSRSMVLVLPVVPLGWMLARSSRWWGALHLAPVLAGAALLLPAHHVVSRFVLPVAPFWAGPDLSETYTHLARSYETGEGAPRDPAAARAWLRKAAEARGPEHKYNLAVALEQSRDVPPDYAEAAKWYRVAAEQGFRRAQTNLGSLYSEGRGVARDSVEAAKWFRLAAQQNDAVGQSNLAGLLASGEGIARDPVEAVRWYRLAAEQNYAPAQCSLGVLYANGTGVAQDMAEAARWFRRAAEKGYVPAEDDLGVMYVRGSGVPKDEVEALAWFDLAAAAHDELGIKYHDLLVEHLGPAAIEAASRRSRALLK